MFCYKIETQVLIIMLITQKWFAFGKICPKVSQSDLLLFLLIHFHSDSCVVICQAVFTVKACPPNSIRAEDSSITANRLLNALASEGDTDMIVFVITLNRTS